MSEENFVGVYPADDRDKMVSALSYIFMIILPAIILLSDLKNSHFNRVHAFQGLVAGGAAIVFYIVYSIFWAIATGIFWPLACVLWVGYFVPAVPLLYIAFKVFTAGQVNFPYLTPITRQFFKDL